MKRYAEYKETEYDWLGSVPAEWKWLYLSQSCKEQDIKNVGNAVSDVLSLSYGQIIRRKNIDTGLAPKDYSTYQIVDSGNIILRLTDLQNDHRSLRTGLVRERGIITSAYVCLQTSENPAYIQYLLHSYDTQKYFYGLGGGVRQSIGYKDIRYIKIPLPPRDEQDQIVRYLDWKVSLMNKLINAKRRQIALLQEESTSSISGAISHGVTKGGKYKATDIHWIDELPESWSVSTMKNHFNIEKRIAGKEGYDVLSITQNGLKIKDVSSNEGQIAASYANYQFVYPGDFAMNHMDLLTGYVDIASCFGVTSPDYRVFCLTDRVRCHPDYFLRVFQVCYKRKIFYGYGRGAASHGRWRMPRVNFVNFQIPLPPINEQMEIADYCDSVERTTKRIIDTLESELTLLSEYRTRLISDVVTGKLDVRGVVVPEYETVEDIVDDKVEVIDTKVDETEGK